MNGDGDGFTPHCGCVFLGGALALGAVAIFLTLGWRWLWLVPAALAAFWVFMLVVTLFEDRWRAVTPEHVRRGVPDLCASCGHELDVLLRKASFKTRCPICGHQGSGALRG